MDKNKLIDLATEFIRNTESNFIPEDRALSKDMIGLKLWDEPIFAFGDPSDVLFQELKNDNIIGSHLKLPHEWLDSAETIISFFLPFTEEICADNRNSLDWPSDTWMHGRIDGQNCLNDLTIYLRDILIEKGYECVVPAIDKNFTFNLGWGDIKVGLERPYSSNWSERHAAYISGLGSFGLSKSLITKKGTAGRFGSLITNLKLEHTNRTYDLNNKYCDKCGLCIPRCPGDAISFEEGKLHKPCGLFLEETYKPNKPYFGCGLCQTDVPCEFADPNEFE